MNLVRKALILIALNLKLVNSPIIGFWSSSYLYMQECLPEGVNEMLDMICTLPNQYEFPQVTRDLLILVLP